jgi:hypothetical protein
MSLRIGDVSDLEIGDAELIDDLADVGALPRRMMRGGRGAGFGRGRRQLPAPQYLPGRAVPARRLIPSVPGAPQIGLRLEPLGFTDVAFTATSGTALAATTRPQRPFKGKRLVCDIARTGATATGLVRVTEISIGTNNQMVSRNPIGAGAFAATAFDVNLELAACSTALDITVGYSLSVAPAMTDRIDVGTTMLGESVGS